MKIPWVLFIVLGLVSIEQVSAKAKSQVQKKDLSAEKIVEASRDPNNTGWTELNGPGVNGKRFFRYRDNTIMCHAIIDSHVGAVALDCQ